jgi:hypothetical protein
MIPEEDAGLGGRIGGEFIMCCLDLRRVVEVSVATFEDLCSDSRLAHWKEVSAGKRLID